MFFALFNWANRFENVFINLASSSGSVLKDTDLLVVVPNSSKNKMFIKLEYQN